jgi:hypothetical protein
LIWNQQCRTMLAWTHELLVYDWIFITSKQTTPSVLKQVPF